MVLRVLLDLLLIYLAYQFVFNFLVPVFRTTQQVRKGFRDMHERMTNENTRENPTPPKSKGDNKAGDYIDYEEVK